MSLGFPSNPQVGDTYTLGNSTWVWNGTAWQLTSTVTSYDPFTVVRLIVTTSTNSTGTDSGAVIVYGGVGIAKDLYVGGTAYASGSEILTTATVNQYASQTAIFAGTDTAVNTSTGNVTIWNTSNLQSVTDRGSSTTNAIVISNNTNAISTISGALQVVGGVGIGGNLHVGGEVIAQKLVIEFTTITTTIVQTDDIIKTSNTTQSNDTTTGALVIAGGAGIGRDLQVGGEIFRNGISVGYGYTGSLGFTGSAGYTGSQGTTGFTGSQGITGYTGSQGALGYSGSTGYTGSQGAVGFTGSKGDTGFTGSQGTTGFTGSQGTIGFSGSKGDTGFTGSQGITGFTGSKGNTGFTGSQGIIGFSGSVGFTGSQGIIGYTGSVGFTGSQGIIGYTGSQGIIGFTGSVGFTGSQGIIGFTGSLGFTGSRGPSDAIKATDDTASTTLYPVMVNAAGSDQVPKVTTSKLYFNAATGILTVIGEIVANKLTIELTTVTTTLVQTDDIIQTLNTTQAVSTNTGALVIAGGVGIGRNLYVGGSTATFLQNVAVGDVDPFVSLAGPRGVVVYGNNEAEIVLQTSYTGKTGGSGLRLYYGYNSPRLHIEENNNFGIGVNGEDYITLTTSSSAVVIQKTTVATSTTTGALIVAGGAGIGGNVFVGGQMSVGSPEVVGGLTVNYSAATTLLLQRVSDDNGPPEAIGRKSRGTLNAKTSVIANDRLWFFAAAGYYGTEGVDGAWSSNQVGMNFVASENWTATARGTHITWATTQAGQTSRTDKMRLTGDGKLGINTAAPEAVLHVVGDAKITGITTITNVTQSTSTITGALTVAGGVGIGGNLYVGNTIYGTFGGTIATATNAANVAITNDIVSTASHYITFVATSSSVAPIKTAAVSGLVYFPNPGHLAINNQTATDSNGYGGSVLDIRGPIYVRQFNSTINYLGLGVNLSNTYINAEGTTNRLIVRVAGSERMRITANGNVGIGTTVPDTITNTGSPHLVVKGLGDLLIAQATTTTNGEVAIGPDYIFQNQNQSLRIGTNNSQKAVFTNNGRFGLGVASPRAPVDLGSANNVGQVILLGETSANVRVGFGLDAATAGMRIFTLNQNDQFIDFGGISGSDGISWTRNHSLGIAGKNSWVNEQGGNFGVGLTSPTEKLEVNGNVHIYGAAGAIGTGLSYYLGPSNNSRDLSVTRVAAGTMGIGRYVSGAWAESVRITNTANVGIATTSPAAGLDIAKVDLRVGVNGGPGIIQIYEAESASISKTGGAVSNDTSASGGQVWGTTANELMYGPYINLQTGNYRLIARMKVTDNTYNGNVARLLVFIGGTAYFSQERFVRGSDFRANNVWETISVPFTVDQATTGNVEYYIQGQNSRQIYVDYIMVVNDQDSYSQHVWGNLGINTNPLYKFHLNNNGNATQAFYADVGNLGSTQVLFEHTGASTPVPFSLRKSGFSGSSRDYGILHLDMAHNVVGGGANLHFTLRDSSSSVTEYGGIGAYISNNSAGSVAGNLALYTTNGGTTRQQRVTVRYDGNVGINTTNPTYKLEVNGSFAATTKSFVIDHPIKEGMKLRYGSLEGPENGVYVRGKLKGTDTIQLPDYWTALVDKESITVTLTPIGKYQKLFVKEIVDNKVIISNDNLLRKEIDCFYVVYGERADVEKLIVEVPIDGN